MSAPSVIRDLTPSLTTFSTPFNRFAPFGYRKFVAVGLRSVAIKLHDGRILLLNPIRLDKSVLDRLISLGGVHFIGSDLGHHLFIKDYLSVWPGAKTIGVPGLDGKRKDVKFDFIYQNKERKPEDVFDFADEMESVMFEGFMTYAVAWYHKPSKTMIETDLLLNLPSTEVCLLSQTRALGKRPLNGMQQYPTSSNDYGILSWAFGSLVYPKSTVHRFLMYYIATTDYVLMRRDAKRVAEWDIERIVPCHGDNIEGSEAHESWVSLYSWFLQGPPTSSLFRRALDMMSTVARRVYLE